MTTENPPAKETLDQPDTERTQVGWGFWVLWTVSLAVVGALSYRIAAEAPAAEHALPPVALGIFGLLAGGVQGFVLRRQGTPVGWWILASSVAGFLAAFVSLVTTVWVRTSAGLLAGWAYAWAAYGAVSGVMLQRISRGRPAMLAGLVGWALAGIVSGALGWATDVCLVRDTTGPWDPVPSTSRTWSMEGLAMIGAVCGAIGGAITGAVLVWLLRRPTPQRDDAAREPKDARHAIVAGVIMGFIAAALCTCLAPVLLTVPAGGSWDSLDLTTFLVFAFEGSPLCVPTIAIVSIPLSIGCGYLGLEIARARGRPASRTLVWFGAAVGGLAGVVLGSLLILAIGF